MQNHTPIVSDLPRDENILTFEIAPRVKKTELATYTTWWTDCGRYRVGRADSNFEYGSRFFASEGRERIIKTDLKTLESAINAVKEYHTKKYDLEAVAINEDELLGKAEGKGLDQLPVIIIKGLTNEWKTSRQIKEDSDYHGLISSYLRKMLKEGHIERQEESSNVFYRIKQRNPVTESQNPALRRAQKKKTLLESRKEKSSLKTQISQDPQDFVPKKKLKVRKKSGKKKHLALHYVRKKLRVKLAPNRKSPDNKVRKKKVRRLASH